MRPEADLNVVALDVLDYEAKEHVKPVIVVKGHKTRDKE
jgi:hypothetical protein